MAYIIHQKLYSMCVYVCIYICTSLYMDVERLTENWLKRSCFSEQICTVKLFQACFNMLEFDL